MRRHDLDVISLVFGLAFAGLGLAFLAGWTTATTLRWAWIWPLLLVGVGVSTVLSVRPRDAVSSRESESHHGDIEDGLTPRPADEPSES